MNVTLKEFYKSTISAVFFRQDGRVKEYFGEKYGEDLLIKDFFATSYPMYKDVIEVTVRPKP